jgi:glucose/arabinose dehydrogenase
MGLEGIDRRTLLKAGVAAPAVTSASLLLAAPAEASPRVGRTLARGLDYPWGIGFLPSGNALVTERNSGRVLRVQPSGGVTEIGTVPGVFNGGGEGGLMGLAVSPTFSRDRWVYVFVTTRVDNRILRMRYTSSGLGAAQVVLGGIPRGLTHNGGGLMFSRGRRPSLFASTGDTRRPELAQRRGSLAGKILRMKPDGSPQDGNPFGNRVFTRGHRNPQGIALDRFYNIWCTELGENTWDELNRIRRGRNYGWPAAEGSDGPGGYSNPFTQWHPENCSPSGLAVARGRAWIGALRGESLWSVDLAGRGARRRERHFEGRFGRIRMVKRAPDGSLWIGTSNGGGRDRIVRIRLG